MPEEAAIDFLNYVRGFQIERSVFATESGLAEYDPELEGFGPLGEQGYINGRRTFDKFDGERSEQKMYDTEGIDDQYHNRCREQGWDLV